MPLTGEGGRVTDTWSPPSYTLISWCHYQTVNYIRAKVEMTSFQHAWNCRVFYSWFRLLLEWLGSSVYGAGGLGGLQPPLFWKKISFIRAKLMYHLGKDTVRWDTCCSERQFTYNRRQKTTFVSQFITHVLTKSSVNFNQGLRAMTRRFCAHWAKSYSAVLQASTTSKLYQISMAWIVKCYQVRSQSLKTTTAGTHAREKTQPWW